MRLLPKMTVYGHWTKRSQNGKLLSDGVPEYARLDETTSHRRRRGKTKGERSQFWEKLSHRERRWADCGLTAGGAEGREG